MRFDREFFLRDELVDGPEILGNFLIRKIGDKIIKTKIVEVEAYMGPEDRASHAYENKRTSRTEPMFSLGGNSYVYLIYGMYNCMNIVCQEEGRREALLIREVNKLN